MSGSDGFHFAPTLRVLGSMFHGSFHRGGHVLQEIVKHGYWGPVPNGDDDRSSRCRPTPPRTFALNRVSPSSGRQYRPNHYRGRRGLTRGILLALSAL